MTPNPGTAAAAFRAGDGLALLIVLMTKQPETVKKIGAKVDTSRWDIMQGRALLGAHEWLLAQPEDVIRDFLPALAIAAVRELYQKNAKKRERAAIVIDKLRPFVARSEWVADLVARSGCHYLRAHDSPEHAKSMRELASAYPKIRANSFYKELVKLR